MERDPFWTRRRWLHTAAAAVWWTLDGFTSTTNYLLMSAGDPHAMPWERVAGASMLSAWLWIPLTVLALWLAERFPLEGERLRLHLGVHMTAALGACLARGLAVVALNPWVGWYAEIPPLGELMMTSVANNFFRYWMLVGVGHALHFARRYRERDEQLARAQLDALKMQLHPHFLFNTLNTVVAFVHRQPDKAERMITQLSQLLRNTLDSAGVHEVSLADELEVARSYLDIEQARFEDRLRVEWRIDPTALEARVPHLVLQPLLENAVRHGIAPRAEVGTIEVTAERSGSHLQLSVRDDGVGVGTGKGKGVGLANVRARLRQLHGAHGIVEAVGVPGTGFEVRIRLPYREQRPSPPITIRRANTLADLGARR